LRYVGWIRSLASHLAARGLSPNAISVMGVGCALGGGVLWALTSHLPAYATWLWLGGALLMLLRILANTLDGMVAIEGGKATRVGLLYNEAPDRLSDICLMVGAGYAQGGSIELGYAAACVALLVAYVRILARLAGAPSDFCGPMDKGGRMIVLLLAAVFASSVPAPWQPQWGPAGDWGASALALLIVCVGGAYTVARRLRRAARHLDH
jgi:phosphatidylglycerophosphate synthase